MTTNQIRDGTLTPRMGVADLQLEMLELLPCGCVVAVQRMPQSEVRVVCMEAKGPHCPYGEHRANKVMRLGEVPDSFDDDYVEEGVRAA